MGKKELLDYVKDYIESKDAIEIIKSADTVNEVGFDLWSFKKLILLEYYIKPYLSICLNRGYRCFFIDLFSGCGANKIEGEKILSIGSPIVSLLKGVIPNKSKNRNNRFFKWFFIEYNVDLYKALRLRATSTVEILNKKYGENLQVDKNIKILYGNCNEKIMEIVDEIKKEAESNEIAVLAFIDPYTFTNIEWKTWEKLLTLTYIDIIFTFPTGAIKRGLNKCKEKEKYLPPTLIKKLKEGSLKDISEHEFEELYAKDIVNLVRRSINYYDKGISVKNTKNVELYRIELFTHSKRAAQITEEIAKKLDKITAKDLKAILDCAQGKSKSLTEFQ